MVELVTLGGLNLRRKDKRVDPVLSQPKRTALLVYLAIARPRGFHARHTLLALLWPESDGRRARRSLRKALHFLRRHLGKEALVSSGDAVRLSDDVWCDVVALDEALEAGELREAVELYGGELLSGFHVSGALEFERWLDAERRRLRQRVVRAAWELAGRAEGADRPIEATRFGRRAWSIEPLDELNTRRLMSLLHRLGDRAGALRVYELAVERLRAELEVEPSAETRELRDRILTEPDGSPAPGEGSGAVKGREEGAPDPAVGVAGRTAPAAGTGEARDGEAGASPPGPRLPPAPAVPAEPSRRAAAPERLTSSGRRSGARRRGGRDRLSRARTAAPGLLLLAVLLGGGLSVGRLDSDEGPSGEAAATVAILPFGVGGDEDELWREGMATLLASSFHGAMRLSAREPEYVLKLWKAEFGDAVPTTELARQAGRRLGAGWVVTGRLVRDGMGIRLSGEAVRTSDGERAGPVVVDGRRDSLFAVVDRFTVELLRRGMAAAEGTGLTVELSRVTTSSLEALEAYLEGEQYWRSALLEEAGEAFTRAIRHDSTFALAHYRLAIVHHWLGPRSAVLPRLRSAVRHADRLHDREASLVRGALALEEGRIAEGLDTLRALTVRELSYAEAWTRYGNAVLHFGPSLLIPLSEFRRSLLRAIEVNPLASEPFWRLVDDAFFREDSSEAARLVEAYRRVDPNSPACIGYETAFFLRWGNEVARDLAEGRMDTLGGGIREPLTCALTVLEMAPRHRPALEIVAAEMESEDRPDSEQRRPATFRLRSDLRAGRIAAARQSLQGFYREAWRQAAARLVLFLDMTTYEDDDDARGAARVLQEGTTPEARFWLGAWHAHRGETAGVRDAIETLRADGDRETSADLARALELLTDPDLPVTRRARLLTDVQSRLGSRFSRIAFSLSRDPLIGEWLRFRVGEMLLEAGEPSAALRYLESLTMYSYPLVAPSFLLRGAAHEALEDVEAARESYERFLRWWSDADPELEPWKERAREGLRRLGVPAG